MAILARLPYVRWAVPVALVALVGHAVVLLLWPAAHLLLIDLQVYRAGAAHVLTRHAAPLFAPPEHLLAAVVHVVSAEHLSEGSLLQRWLSI